MRTPSATPIPQCMPPSSAAATIGSITSPASTPGATSGASSNATSSRRLPEQIFVVFQPIVDAHTHRICAVEAWRVDPSHQGPNFPRYLHFDRRGSGLIVELGKSDPRTGLPRRAHWPYRLRGQSFAAAIPEPQSRRRSDRRRCERCDFPPSRLKFDITETYRLRRPDAAEAVIRRCAARRAHRARHFGTAMPDRRPSPASSSTSSRSTPGRGGGGRTPPPPMCSNAIVLFVQGARRADPRRRRRNPLNRPALLDNNGCAHLQGWNFGRPCSCGKSTPSLGMRGRLKTRPSGVQGPDVRGSVHELSSPPPYYSSAATSHQSIVPGLFLPPAVPRFGGVFIA